MEVKMATKEDLPLLYPTLRQLRPQLTYEVFEYQFEIQRNQSYQIIYLGDGEAVYVLAGFRTLYFFYSGKTLYIDDLVTNEEYTKKGFAGQLLDWLKTYASENQYDHISLDSGFTRKDAHRLYLKHGFEIECLHFGYYIDV